MNWPDRLDNSVSGPYRSRWTAILTLATLFIATAALLRAGTTTDLASRYQNQNLDDAIFYERVATRVDAGENYYLVANRELHARGYETSSTFNWRTPLYAHALGKFQRIGILRVALAGLSLLTAALVACWIARELGRSWGVVAGCMVFASSAWWLQPEPAWFTEVWAGQLILLTVAAQGLNRPGVALVAGACALFLRELALPFVVLCLGDAWVRRRWSEALGWSLCLVLHGFHFLLHESQVAFHQFPDRFHPPSDRANWVEWGGLPFVLATTRMNYLLSFLPTWCAALYLPPACFGLVALGLSQRTARVMLLGFLGYLVAFLVVGKEFNFYWGWITAPTLALGFAVSPVFLVRFIRDQPKPPILVPLVSP